MSHKRASRGIFGRSPWLAVWLVCLVGSLSQVVRADCSCGSTDSAAPCTGNTVSLVRGSSTVSFSFQCGGGECACGKFANQWDFWVAPKQAGEAVAIIDISPATTGAADTTLRSGWIANPRDADSSGIDGRLGANGTGTPLVPTAGNPFVVGSGAPSVTSIVKGISKNPTGACTDTAPDGTRRFCFDQIEVLTVLTSVPDGAGSAVLRPPYFGPPGQKQAIPVNQIRFDLLSAIRRPVRPDGAVVSPNFTPDQAVDYVKGFKIDWGLDYPSTQNFKASTSFSGQSMGYSPGPWGRYWDAMHWIALDGIPDDRKRLLAIWAVQHGEDVLSIARNYKYQNGPWVPNGGHSVGRYGLAVLAAALIQDGGQRSAWLQNESTSAVGRQRFAETGQIQKSEVTGKVTYGAMSVSGGKTFGDCSTQLNPINADPNGLVDNSKIRYAGTNCTLGSLGSYQDTSFPAMWSQYNLLSAIPTARRIAYPVGIAYVQRMTGLGAASLNDQYDPPLAVCAAGVSAGRYCFTSADCAGQTCTNRRPNLSDPNYNSYVSANMWYQYKDCYTTDSCPGSALPKSTAVPPASPALQVQ
jgi:hypothetical protein